MCRYVEVNDMAAVVTHDHEGEEHSEYGRRHSEEVDGNDVSQMITQKRTPRL